MVPINFTVPHTLLFYSTASMSYLFAGAFIDQSQSLNAFVSEPDYDKLTSMHFHGWKRGLKTGKIALK